VVVVALGRDAGGYEMVREYAATEILIDELGPAQAAFS
jgi:hypothetical protein